MRRQNVRMIVLAETQMTVCCPHFMRLFRRGMKWRSEAISFDKTNEGVVHVDPHQ